MLYGLHIIAYPVSNQQHINTHIHQQGNVGVPKVVYSDLPDIIAAAHTVFIGGYAVVG